MAISIIVPVNPPLGPGGGGPPPGGTPTGDPGDVFTIAAGVTVGDVVYISIAGDVDVAFGGVVGQTGDAIGVVVELVTATTARVLSQGLSGAIFSGLTIGETYYLSNVVAGNIMTPAPSTDGSKSQEIGRASATNELYIDVDATSILL